MALKSRNILQHTASHAKHAYTEAADAQVQLVACGHLNKCAMRSAVDKTHAGRSSNYWLECGIKREMNSEQTICDMLTTSLSSSHVKPMLLQLCFEVKLNTKCTEAV